MCCTLQAAEFTLSLEPFFFSEDAGAPVDTILRIRVWSSGFAAESSMDVGMGALSRLADSLEQLYRALAGEAVLEEPYGAHQYIRFSAQRGGHLLVQGYLSRSVPGLPEQELRFANRLDQTYLRPFLLALHRLIPHT